MSCQLHVVSSRFKPLNDFLGDRKLDPDVTYETIASALQEPFYIKEKLVKVLKGGGIPEWSMPCSLHNIQEVGTFSPKGMKKEPSLASALHIKTQQQRNMIRVVRGKGVEIALREHLLRILTDECLINALKGWVLPL
jgi:hypothetical protein